MISSQSPLISHNLDTFFRAANLCKFTVKFGGEIITAFTAYLTEFPHSPLILHNFPLNGGDTSTPGNAFLTGIFFFGGGDAEDLYVF